MIPVHRHSRRLFLSRAARLAVAADVQTFALGSLADAQTDQQFF